MIEFSLLCVNFPLHFFELNFLKTIKIKNFYLKYFHPANNKNPSTGNFPIKGLGRNKNLYSSLYFYSLFSTLRLNLFLSISFLRAIEFLDFTLAHLIRQLLLFPYQQEALGFYCHLFHLCQIFLWSLGFLCPLAYRK